MRGSTMLPTLTVSKTGVIIEGDAASQTINIEWSRFREFIDLMTAAKESAILLGFTTRKVTDENQG
jgi:hypothetical protein